MAKKILTLAGSGIAPCTDHKRADYITISFNFTDKDGNYIDEPVESWEVDFDYHTGLEFFPTILYMGEPVEVKQDILNTYSMGLRGGYFCVPRATRQVAVRVHTVDKVDYIAMLEIPHWVNNPTIRLLNSEEYKKNEKVWTRSGMEKSLGRYLEAGAMMEQQADLLAISFMESSMELQETIEEMIKRGDGRSFEVGDLHSLDYVTLFMMYYTKTQGEKDGMLSSFFIDYFDHVSRVIDQLFSVVEWGNFQERYDEFVGLTEESPSTMTVVPPLNRDDNIMKALDMVGFGVVGAYREMNPPNRDEKQFVLSSVQEVEKIIYAKAKSLLVEIKHHEKEMTKTKE